MALCGHGRPAGGRLRETGQGDPDLAFRSGGESLYPGGRRSGTGDPAGLYGHGAPLRRRPPPESLPLEQGHRIGLCRLDRPQGSVPLAVRQLPAAGIHGPRDRGRFRTYFHHRLPVQWFLHAFGDPKGLADAGGLLFHGRRGNRRHREGRGPGGLHPGSPSFQAEDHHRHSGAHRPGKLRRRNGDKHLLG